MADDFSEKVRHHLDKIRNSLRAPTNVGEAGVDNLGVVKLPLSQIQEDPNFVNIRKSIDPEKLEELQESLQRDGQQTPITVRSSDFQIDTNTVFWIRAGFRRLAAARNLGWSALAAHVIPADAPDIADYWINFTENCQREAVSPYEIACQSRMLIRRFAVEPGEVARRANLSLDTIRNYLRYLEWLPDDVLTAWQGQHPYLNHRV